MLDFINNDPLLGNYKQDRTQLIEEYRRKVEMQQGSRTPLWDKIDAELSPLTEEQKKIVYSSPDYIAVQNEISQMVQAQMLNMIKPYIENSEQGKALLNKAYDIAVAAKKNAIAETNRDMEMFKQWQNYSISHPNSTYQDFIKAITKKSK